jgi:nucleoid-associated protein YgaU
MNKNVWMLTGACALAVGIAGCSPQLDQTRLSPEEQAWADSIKANYSAWQPPESIPRSVRRDDIPQQNTAPAVAGESTEATVPAVNDAEVTLTAPATAPAADTPAVEPVAPVAPAANDAAAAPAAAENETYTVNKGDTLSGIALKFYGRASAWKKIADANADVLKGKTVIKPGMKLAIPRP